MLGLFRRYLGTWAARLLFMVLVAAFGLWGIADVVRNLAGGSSAVAIVAGHDIDPAQVQEVYQRELARTTRMMGQTQPTAAMRMEIAQQAVQQLITQAAINAEVDRLGVVVPDASLRQAVFAMPAFHGSDGNFDRATFQSVLANNSLTEPRFLELMRNDLASRQVMGAVAAGASAPDTLTNQVYQFQHEARVADTAEFPFADTPAPQPTEAQLTRWWENHPERYSTPEYRRIKAVILSPETLAKDIPVSDAELHAAYDQHKAEYVVPEQRSVQVLLTPDEAAAKALAAQWRGGADWTQMQAAAKAAGGSAVELDDAASSMFPAAELSRAVFAATPDTVADPVHSPLGWHVLKVIKVTPGSNRGFDQVKDELRTQIAQGKAVDQVYDRANKVEDLLAGGAKLDELPGDLGLAAVAGTLDAQGNTQEGTPAPIPGGAELRQALVGAAFAMHQGDPPHLTEAPDHAEYAVTVEQITPPARKKLDQVRDQVLADWQHDAQRAAQNAAATKMMVAVQGGQSFADAATVAGVTVRRTPPIPRDTAPAGVPHELVDPLFSLKPKAATMVETPDGFVVAQLAEVQEPDPKADPAGFGQARAAMTQSVAADLQSTFAAALRQRANARINPTALASIVQP